MRIRRYWQKRPQRERGRGVGQAGRRQAFRSRKSCPLAAIRREARRTCRSLRERWAASCRRRRGTRVLPCGRRAAIVLAAQGGRSPRLVEGPVARSATARTAEFCLPCVVPDVPPASPLAGRRAAPPRSGLRHVSRTAQETDRLRAHVASKTMPARCGVSAWLACSQLEPTRQTSYPALNLSGRPLDKLLEPFRPTTYQALGSQACRETHTPWRGQGIRICLGAVRSNFV